MKNHSTTIIISIFCFLNIYTAHFAGDVWKKPEDIARAKEARYKRIESMSTEEMIQKISSVDTRKTEFYGNSLAYDIPIMCQILVKRNAMEALPVLKKLSIQGSGTGEGSFYNAIHEASKALVLLKYEKQLSDKKEMEKVTVLKKIRDSITPDKKGNPLTGLESETNVIHYGCSSLIQELTSKIYAKHRYDLMMKKYQYFLSGSEKDYSDLTSKQ